MNIEAIAEAIDQAWEQHGPANVFALFSGGHDSLTSTGIAFEWGAQHDIPVQAVHINTGIGIEATREFVRSTCADHGWPLTELFAPEGKYEELVLTRGGFPGGLRSHHSMLFYLKQQPLSRWFAGTTGTGLFVTGIRKQESVRRMGSGISVPVRKDGRKVWVNPILDWSKLDCGTYMRERGLDRNQVVDLLHRSGECLCGALAREEERLEIAQWFPTENGRITELERECERRGITACVWAGRNANRLVDGQELLFSKADYVPLCTSCEAAADRPEGTTHGRHCSCSGCAKQDWTDTRLAPCGMHGPSCPNVYAPVAATPCCGDPGDCGERCA